jgi:hypothetical protein
MIREIHTDRLNDFIVEVDNLGGPNSPEAIAAFPLINLKFKTKVDVNLDPFSDLYFSQQIELHQEITGRAFNQEINELGAVYDPLTISAHNPNSSFDVANMAGHIRAVSTTMLRRL